MAVLEWVQDSWHSNYNGAPTDGSAWERDGSAQVRRGGGCVGIYHCRSATRKSEAQGIRNNMLGFRLVRDL